MATTHKIRVTDANVNVNVLKPIFVCGHVEEGRAESGAQEEGRSQDRGGDGIAGRKPARLPRARIGTAQQARIAHPAGGPASSSQLAHLGRGELRDPLLIIYIPHKT